LDRELTDATRGPLAGRDFRSMWAGSTVSSFGTAVSSVALPLIAVSSLHASTFQVGILEAAATVAWLLIGLHAGLWVERLRRRPVMIFCDLIRAAMLVSIPAAAVAHVLTLTQLVAVAFGMGVVAVVYGVARQTYTPQLVGREHLVAANGRTDSAQAAATGAGQVVGGVLVALIGGALAILVDVGSYFASAWMMTRIGMREAKPERPAVHEPWFPRLTAGLSFIFRDPVVRPLILTTAAYNLTEGAFATLLVPFLVRDVRTDAEVVGLLMALAHTGSFVGASVTGPLVRKAGPVKTLFLATFAAPVFILLLPIPASVPIAVGLAAVALTVRYTGGPILSILSRSHRQASVPPELTARVAGSIRFVTWGVLPIGSLLGGVLGSAFGNQTAMWLVCAAVALSGLPLALAAAVGGRGFLAELRG
jgi:predicted MFS family arabinose efflux permease